MMTLEDFKNKVDLYSADLSRWPSAEVKPAISFMREKAEAQKYFDAGLLLDTQLRGYAPSLPAAAGALEDRILRGIAAFPKEQPGLEKQGLKNKATKKSGVESGFFRLNPAWIAAPGGGLLAAAVLGFIIGLSPAKQGDTLVDPVYYSKAQIIHGDAELYNGGMF